MNGYTNVKNQNRINRSRRNIIPFLYSGFLFGNRRSKPVRRSKAAPLLAGVMFAAALESIIIGEEGRAAVASIMRDPLSIIDARSPGRRGVGPLLSTKERRSAPIKPKMVEPAPAGGGVPEQPPTAYFAAPEIPLVEDVPSVAPYDDGPAVPAGMVFGLPYFGGGIVFGGGGPGLFSGNSEPVPPENPPPPSAIPEPASWMALFAGMIAVGSLLRREKRALVRRASIQDR